MQHKPGSVSGDTAGIVNQWRNPTSVRVRHPAPNFMKQIVPKTYTSIDAVGIPASGVGKASVEEIREEKPPIPDPKRKLDLTVGPFKSGPKKLPVKIRPKKAVDK